MTTRISGIADPATSPCCGVWVPARAGTTAETHCRVLQKQRSAGTNGVNSDSSSTHLALELVHQRATHRVAGQLDAVGIAINNKVLAAEIVVQVFDSRDPVSGDGDVHATAERPAGEGQAGGRDSALA